jgi:membrane protein DedA with SNARE-associated domain
MLNSLILMNSQSILPYCILMAATMIEGPITLLIGGVAISRGLLQPIPVYLAVVTGNLLGDSFWYGLGRFAKIEWIARIGAKFGLNLQKVKQLQQGIQKLAPKLLFCAKFTIGLPIPTLIAVGLSHVPPYRWIGALVLGELIKSAAFVAVGYMYTSAIQQASTGIQIILWGMTAVVVCGGMIWFKLKKRKHA